jgi:hypothetical protein
MRLDWWVILGGLESFRPARICRGNKGFIFIGGGPRGNLTKIGQRKVGKGRLRKDMLGFMLWDMRGIYRQCNWAVDIGIGIGIGIGEQNFGGDYRLGWNWAGAGLGSISISMWNMEYFHGFAFGRAEGAAFRRAVVSMAANVYL